MFSKGGQQYTVKELMDGLAKLNNEEEEAVPGLTNEWSHWLEKPSSILA